MASYTVPEMPLRADVWFEAPGLPPPGPPDASDVHISLSPLTPNQAITLQSEVSGGGTSTHIIRTLTDLRIADSYTGPPLTLDYPCTVWEVPAGSGHYYRTDWAHIVGAGFPNEHHRVYVTRWKADLSGPKPWFIGYI